MYKNLNKRHPVIVIRSPRDPLNEGSIKVESTLTTESLPTGSGKGFTIPLLAPTREYSGEGIMITFLFKEDFVFRNLVRKLLFKGVTCLEWFIIFRNFDRNLKKRESLFNALVFGMLNLSSNTRMSLDDWHFQTKPLIKLGVLSQRYPSSELGNKTILELIDHFVKFPPTFQEVYSFKRITIPFIEPKKPLVIGVGYKDHGSLKPNHKWLPFVREYTPPSPNLFKRSKEDWTSMLEILNWDS